MLRQGDPNAVQTVAVSSRGRSGRKWATIAGAVSPATLDGGAIDAAGLARLRALLPADYLVLGGGDGVVSAKLWVRAEGAAAAAREARQAAK